MSIVNHLHVAPGNQCICEEKVLQVSIPRGGEAGQLEAYRFPFQRVFGPRVTQADSADEIWYLLAVRVIAFCKTQQLLRKREEIIFCSFLRLRLLQVLLQLFILIASIGNLGRAFYMVLYPEKTWQLW
eukprot:5075052-Amphidinium_carterae.1